MTRRKENHFGKDEPLPADKTKKILIDKENSQTEIELLRWCFIIRISISVNYKLATIREMIF